MHYFASTDSTNQQALDAIQRGGVPHGSVFFADAQSAGRGTAGNRWESPPGEGLWFSVVLVDPPQPLAFAPAIAIVDVCRRECGIDAHAKWPNDVLVENRKLAGVLIESTERDGQRQWVVGVGLNVLQREFPTSLGATSLWCETQRAWDRVEVYCRVLRRLGEALSERDLIAAWRARCRMFGSRVTAEKRSRDGVRQGVVELLGLDVHGHLRVRWDDGDEEVVIAASEWDLGRHPVGHQKPAP